MVNLELQLPTTPQNLSGSLHQVDALAALQQLSLQHRAARVVSSRAAQGTPAVSQSHQIPYSVVHLAEQQRTARDSSPCSRQCTSSRSRNTPQTYTNDGVRLSELGEQPLAVGTPRPPVFEEEELSFSLPAAQNIAAIYSSAPGAADEQIHSHRRKYVCNTKDDPLVKGRLANSISVLIERSYLCWQSLCAMLAMIIL